MKELLEASALYFYTDLITVLCALLATIIGFIQRKKHEGLRFMFLYPLVSLQQSVSFYIVRYFIRVDNFFTSNFSVIVFLLVEFFCLYIYYYIVIKNRFRKILQVVLVVYLFSLVYKWGENGFRLLVPNNFYFIQSIIILALAIIYLLFLFVEKPKPNLFNEPSFWITIGALLYFLCTVPIYVNTKYVFTEDGLIDDPSLFSINYICYSLFFILLTRAYLCKAPAKP